MQFTDPAPPPLPHVLPAGYEAVVTYLCAQGALVDAATDGGATPLMNAAAAGHVGTMRALLLAGATLDQPDAVGVAGQRAVVRPR